jgi:BioD-like phosphotransacetylase family protein
MYNPQTTRRLQNLDFNIQTDIQTSVSCLMLYMKLKINYECICVYHCVTI